MLVSHHCTLAPLAQKCPIIPWYPIVTKQLKRACDAGPLLLTLTAWFGSVPLRSPAAAHDTLQCGVALEQVASLAMKCHHGTQLVVSTHSSAIHQIAGIKTCLP